MFLPFFGVRSSLSSLYATKGMEALDDFYTDHPFVDWYMTTQEEGHSQKFLERIGFWTWWLSILRMQLQTNMLCKMLIVYISLLMA